MINSYSNAKLKMVRELLNRSRTRKKAGAFVIEGIRMFNEVPQSLLKEVYVSREFHEKHPEIEGEIVEDGIFKKLSDTKTPQGILAVVGMPEFDLESALSAEKGLYLILERVQDPGNLGTMIRTAEAAGAECIIMDNETADIYSPKVVRSTMGSLYRLPCFYVSDLPETIGRMKEKGIGIYAADLKGDRYYHEEDYPEKTGFLIGNEGNGLSDGILSLADSRIKIPMKGRSESLNAAIAAAVLMYGFVTRKE